MLQKWRKSLQSERKAQKNWEYKPLFALKTVTLRQFTGKSLCEACPHSLYFLCCIL